MDDHQDHVEQEPERQHIASQAVFVIAGDQLFNMLLEKRKGAIVAGKLAGTKHDRQQVVYQQGVADALTGVLKALKAARVEWEGMGSPSAFEAAIVEAQAMVARAYGWIGFFTWAAKLRHYPGDDCDICDSMKTPMEWAIRVG